MANLDAKDRPIYSVTDAARYLWVPAATLRAWAFGREFPAHGRTCFSEPVISSADPERHLLSFVNLLELHVLAAIRRGHNIDMRRVRTAVEYLAEHFGHARPLIDATMETDGTDLFVDHLGELVNVSRAGQGALRELLRVHLQRIERDPAGTAVRLFPFTRRLPTSVTDASADPRVIVIDARVAFGRPVLARTRIPTREIAERYKAGDSIEDLAHDYGRPASDIEEAVRCELQVA